MYIEKYGIKTNVSMKDEELKVLLGNIRLNTGFSLPDQLIQDFVNDGSLIPTFKKCMHFNRNDFNSLVGPLKAVKNIKKKLPKKRTIQKKNQKNQKNQKKSNKRKVNKTIKRFK